MIGHTTYGCKTLRNAILDLIDFEKVKDLEKKPSVEIGPLLKNREIPCTKNKSLPNHSIIPQPNIISSSSRESQASDGTPTSQILPTFWNLTSDHHRKREQKGTMSIHPL